MGNKSKREKITDADVRTAENLINLGREQAEAEMTALKEKLTVAPWLYEMLGKVKTLAFTEAQSRFFKLILLKQVKDNKIYREKLNTTWEKFCEMLGLSYRTVDDQLVDLKPFKAEFLTNFVNFSGFDFRKIKYLGNEKLTESVNFSGNAIIFNGETIPITPEHADEIQALLENLEEAYKEQLDDKDSELKAQKRIAQSKEDVIKRQEKALSKFEKDAESKGLTLEEDAFLQRMNNLRIGFDGYMLKVDPDRVDELKKDNKPTPRMIAAYLSSLDYMRKQILAAYDTAVQKYGNPIIAPEKAWKPGMKV